MKKTFSLFVVTILIIFSLLSNVSAHPGRTDSKGGHTNHSTGEYHYHHGYSAHDHYDMDGDGDIDCPYDFDDKTSHSSCDSNGIASSNRATDRPDIQEADSEPMQRSLIDIILAVFEHLLITIAIWLFSSYFLSYICFFIFEKDQGCSIAMILGAVIAIVASIWLLFNR